MERKRLLDILQDSAGGADWIKDDWGDIPAAPDFGNPVPRGSYTAHVIDGNLFNAGTGTAGFKLAFEVIDGEFKGRKLWYDIWLTNKAKGQAVRDLRKIGVTSNAQLELPVPSRRIRCKLIVVVRKGDDGLEYNAVKSFDVLGIDPPPPEDDFAPPPADPGPAPASNGELFPGKGNAASGPYSEGR